MKYLALGAVTLCLFFIPTHVDATQCHGKSCYNVPGKECEHGQHRYNPHCSPTITSSPTGSPYVTTSPSPTAQATSSASPSPTGYPTSSPTESIQPTRQPDRTDLSDGRSDNLGCSVKDCSENRPQVLGLTLPSTGSDTFWFTVAGVLIIAMVGSILSMWREE